MASEQNKSSPLIAEPLSPSNTEGRDEGGGGSGLKTNSKPQSLDLEVAIEEPCSGTSLPMLLITANVGSIFDDPQSLIPQWLAQISQQIKEQKPGFVAIHCQEVGGKKFEKSMANLDNFVTELCSLLTELNFNKTVAFFDKNFAASEKFTALGSIYFLHESLNNVDIYDFQNRCYSRINANSKHHYLGTIDDLSWVEKHKFPLQYFPESRWSRKGYLRTRWRFSAEAIVDMVNIHLFHDASNLKSVESVPSIYVNYRKRALCYTLDRITNHCTTSATSEAAVKHEPKPYFIFGDFNFRLDCKNVVKSLTSDLLDITPPPDVQQESENNKQYVDKRSQELVLSIGKKEFALLRGDNTFRGEWRKWTPYDMEVSDLRDRLTEYPLAFPPTYPFVEDPNAGSSYMRTRCPAWCDRVLMSHQAKSLINDQDDNSAITYDVIGKDVCMGDHKPVFLRCKLKLTSSNLPRRPEMKVESPSYTDLLNSPPPTATSSNGGCSRFMELKDSVKLFKETTV